MESEESSRGGDGRKIISISGAIVFLAGVALLIYTFFTAFSFLTDPEGIIRFSEAFMQRLPPSQGFEGIVQLLISYLLPVLLLFVMGSVASKIASQGIQMLRMR
ncbi:MAG: hypothetical protein H5T47_03345 [Archaeoglobi archaeon]|nr:hypothetical protein [Candidatus Mnemosynella bozhongmuii]